MGRKPRLHVPYGFYHTILRGNNRQAIFHTPKDRNRWEHFLIDALQQYDGTIHCYCWMTNHVHMLIRIGLQPLSRIIQHAASRYSRKCNKLYGNTGHLFERRHRAILATGDPQLLSVVRYIHFNPVKAGLVDTPEQYEWSSHSAFLGHNRKDWLTTDWILRLFSDRRPVALKQYAQFMAETDMLEIEEYDEKDTTVLQTCTEDEDTFEISAADVPLCTTLQEITDQYCKNHDICLDQLRGPSRARILVEIRTDIAAAALSAGVATNAEIARYLNRAESTVCEAIRRRKNITDETEHRHRSPFSAIR